MGYVIAFVLIAILAYLVIRYIIIPVGSVLIIITLSISAGYGLIVSLISFISSLSKNIHPYRLYVDKHTNIPPGIKRNYFFGPGFNQLGIIIKDAYTNLNEQCRKIIDWKDRAIRHNGFVDFWIYIGFAFAIVCTQVLGFIWVTAFSLVLSVVIITGMVGFFLFFSILWFTDRLVLFFKSVHSRCPNCKRKSVIPVFICPTCGQPHRKLVPGPYGVFRRKCSCGTKLATTFLGGRSKYEAHCPYCDNTLFSSSSRQYGIQLVGGTGTGKTTFLVAFWHEYKDWLTNSSHISYTTVPDYAFAELEQWYLNGIAEATTQRNASMYSIIHNLGAHSSVQMTVYDIAGEVFGTAESDVQQQQFHYCEGFILIIDPTSSPQETEEAVGNFINTFDAVKGKRASSSGKVPVAVLITKADLFKKEIGLPKIQSSYSTATRDNISPMSYEEYQNGICRQFLFDHGFGNATNLIDAEFANCRYFSVSAMGHPLEDGEYQPWGVMEPMLWLMRSDNCPLHQIFSQT